MHAVFLDYETVSHQDLDASALRRAIERPNEPGQLTLHESTTEAELAARIAPAEIVLTNKVRLDAPQLAAAPRLKLIALAATGTDNIDLVAAAQRGIAVCNVPEYCTASLVQHVWALILALTRRLPEHQGFIEHGGWREGAEADVLQFSMRELTGRTLGIVGFGTLGRAVAAVAPSFGLSVLIAERGVAPRSGGGADGRGGSARGDADPRRVPLDTLLREADIVSLHCPLTPATRGLIGARELALMKRDALLINTARGGLLDGAALVRALKAGELGGAGLDVLPSEPPSPDEPLLGADIPRLILSPHVAWAAREARQRCLDAMAAAIEDFRCGGKRGRVV
jgi:glycerate dehydrogenase